METKCVKGCEDMRKMHKIFALALGSVLSLSAFAACGGGDVNSTGDAQNYQICFDNLDDSISLSIPPPRRWRSRTRTSSPRTTRTGIR